MNPIGLVLVALVLPVSARAEDLRPGELAPDFTLADLDGRAHHLADLRGRIAVLEWTNHVCPAVAYGQESRILADTRAALDRERGAWLQIDSSWFAPELAEGIRAWRARLALDVPYLLDRDGAVAQSYGATVTPEVFVIDAEGRLAYAGAVDEGALEAQRRNHVVEAVGALLAGCVVTVARTPAEGCSLKLGSPGEGRSVEDVDEDAAACAVYSQAAAAARKGESAAALGLLGRSFDAGLPRPWSVVADEDFRALLAEAKARSEIHRLLEERPARGSLTMVAPREPGDALVLCGTVRDAAGGPIDGALISLYHTDAAGWYSAGSTQGENSRLFGTIATDRFGRYRIRTIFPGHYATSPDGPMHIHMAVRADGYRMQQGHRASVFFESDPALVGESRAEIEGDGCAIRTLSKNAEGVTLCVRDVALERE